jgi:hypothetical protein
MNLDTKDYLALIGMLDNILDNEREHYRARLKARKDVSNHNFKKAEDLKFKLDVILFKKQENQEHA